MARTDLPPVPPAGRGPQGAAREGADGSQPHGQTAMERAAKPTERNLSSQGRQGNIKQNTTHSGHQQDR
jgi:hypothetical protein